MITISKIDTPIGKMHIGSTSKGICMLEFDDDNRMEKHLKHFRKFGHDEFKSGDNKHIKTLKKQLKQYFEKKLTAFDIKLDIIGTDFQTKVWKELLNIPYGATRSYKEQAIAVGDLKAIRAVASANGDNKISIVIPCHRVIGTNGSLTGYGGGLNRKEYLLNLESNQMDMFEISIP